jgi:predicted RNA-binding protein
MTTYLCVVSPKFPENYHIGLQAGVWGVERRYENRISLVMRGDELVFLMGGHFRSFHTIESAPYEDETPLWPPKNDDLYPFRVRISAPTMVGNVDVRTIKDQISFMKDTQAWGGTVQGASGVFNDRLTLEDVQVIKARMRGVSNAPITLDSARQMVSKRASERQAALFKFYERDVEDRMSEFLPRLGLSLYSDITTGKAGRQFPIPSGRIDLLCNANVDGAFVVVELKKGEAPNEALLQILRYMSWVRQNLANGKDVRGIILTESVDPVLVEIVKEVPNVSIRHYQVTINLV